VVSRLKPICHLNLASGYRGGERQAELLIRELAKRGRPQRLVIRKGNALAERCADVDNLDVREVAANPLAAGLAVRGSAIAHSHEARTVYSCLLANWLFGVPYVITRRVVAPQSASTLRTLAYRRAGRVAAVSRAAGEKLLERMPGLEYAVVPDAIAGFDHDEASAAAIRAARPGKILIGHVGALDHSHKGQSTIIEVAHRVADTHPDWRFMFCGDGRDEERFRTEIGDLTNVELVGWVDNVGDYLAAFDLFVYPSLHEALGSTILDAMLFGLPVVATAVGGIPDFVEDGVHGRLVEPENAVQLQAAIEEVLSDEAGLAEMRERNAAHAAQYDAAHMADLYENLYREIVT
jgi:glycosyltransferase involved in cell wall biosynthesis